MAARLERMRAREYVRSFSLPFRDELLLGNLDGCIVEIAEADGYELTCLGDIQRERDAALRRLPEPA